MWIQRLGWKERFKTVSRNRAHNNSRFDVFYDGTGTNNTFIRNRCGTSNAEGLCGE